MSGGLVRFLVTVGTIACYALPLRAQVIRGTIRAQESQTPVPGARVTVTDTTNAVLAEVVSGPEGKFYLSFKAPSRFVVGVRKVGHAATNVLRRQRYVASLITLSVLLRIDWENRRLSRGFKV